VCVCVWSEVNATRASQHQHHPAIQFTAVASCDLLCSLMCCARPAVGRISFHRRACVREPTFRGSPVIRSASVSTHRPRLHTGYSQIPLHGPDRTRTDFFAIRISEKLRWVRAGLRQSPRGSSRARVVEFSLYGLQLQAELLRSAAP